jgi:hypothetical protein
MMIHSRARNANALLIEVGIVIYKWQEGGGIRTESSCLHSFRQIYSVHVSRLLSNPRRSHENSKPFPKLTLCAFRPCIPCLIVL